MKSLYRFKQRPVHIKYNNKIHIYYKSVLSRSCLSLRDLKRRLNGFKILAFMHLLFPTGEWSRPVVLPLTLVSLELTITCDHRRR
jgi:hypothetical protein